MHSVNQIPPNHFPLEKQELAFIGMARSGNHSIIHWVLAQLGKTRDTAFLNNIPLDGAPLACASGYGEIIHHPDPSKAELIAYSYEDQLYKDCICRVNKFRPSTKVILIMRDPFNLFASRLRFSRQPSSENNLATRRSIDLWIENAEAFLELSVSPQQVVCISYNSWFKNRWYRDWKAEQIGFSNMDLGRQLVPPHGRGSSFDSFEYDGKAAEMQVTSRWRFYIEDDEWLSFLTPAVLRLSGLIFGAELNLAIKSFNSKNS